VKFFELSTKRIFQIFTIAKMKKIAASASDWLLICHTPLVYSLYCTSTFKHESMGNSRYRPTSLPYERIQRVVLMSLSEKRKGSKGPYFDKTFV
jgi:hypothetical protein